MLQYNKIEKMNPYDDTKFYLEMLRALESRATLTRNKLGKSLESERLCEHCKRRTVCWTENFIHISLFEDDCNIMKCLNYL